MATGKGVGCPCLIYPSQDELEDLNLSGLDLSSPDNDILFCFLSTWHGGSRPSALAVIRYCLWIQSSYWENICFYPHTMVVLNNQHCQFLDTVYGYIPHIGNKQHAIPKNKYWCNNPYLNLVLDTVNMLLHSKERKNWINLILVTIQEKEPTLLLRVQPRKLKEWANYNWLDWCLKWSQ